MRKPHGCHRRAKSGSSNNNTATAISCYFHTGGKLPSSGHTAESLRPPLTRLHARTPNVVNLDHAGNPSGAKLAASPPAKIVRRRILHLVSYRIVSEYITLMLMYLGTARFVPRSVFSLILSDHQPIEISAKISHTDKVRKCIRETCVLRLARRSRTP
jgi:hypothetical protein